MRRSLLLVVSLFCLGAFAQQTLTVDKLVEFMRSAIKNRMPDKTVADYVGRMKLTQKLEDPVIEQLQGEGLGPKTVAALRVLGAASSGQPPADLKKIEAPPPPPPEPPPSPAKQKQVLDEAREYALNYSKSLPNFICAQSTKQYGDPTGAGNYRMYGNVLAKLTYFEQHEKYETITVNDKPTNTAYDKLGGSISTGEFGSMLRGIFDPQTQAEFSWSAWRTIHGDHKAYVFKFFVDQPHSGWEIEDRQSHQKISPAYNGFMWIDVKDNTVLAFTMNAVDLPSTFPITEADSRLDYDTVAISEVPFVLPSKAVMHLRSGKDDQKNEISFHNYHKYSADASLKFDDITPDPPAPPKK
jgi:hypothetical protein